jgi:cell division protein FtsI (penicillin-binding protein 3)
VPVTLLKRSDGDRPARRKVYSPAIARAVRAMMEGVVSTDGTAPLAAVRGYRVAGKTGTVHKSEAGGYAKHRYVALFAGMAPASDPRLVIAVVVNEPSRDEHYGGQVAGPVFSRVMGDALRLLNIPPDDMGPLLETRRPSSGEGPA